MSIINGYSNYWTEIIGTRGFKGKKAINGSANFAKLFFVEDDEPVDAEVDPEEEFDQSKLDALEGDV